MRDKLNFDGKVAIVTGGARGIGREIARTFLEHGGNVVVCDVLEKDGQTTVHELGADAVFMRCDITNSEQVRLLVDSTVERFGKLDILVNNAACNPIRSEDRVPVNEFSDDFFRRTMDVDLNGTFYCSKTAAQQMIHQKSGAIINISSILGVVPLRNQIAHTTGKAGVVRMTEAMALELGQYGIRVNCVSPGSTVTEATRKIFYGEDAAARKDVERLMSFIPLGCPGQTEDIANAVLFLTSDLASYITGHNLVVDGGWTCGFARDF